MKKKKKYYKVTTPDNKSILSEGGHLPPEYVIDYIADGNWIYPRDKQTKIMVFDNRREALTWSRGPCLVHEVEVKNPQTKGVFVPYIGNYYDCGSTFKKLLNILLAKKNKKQRLQFTKCNNVPGRSLQIHDDICYSYAPSHTVFVDCVKMIKCIS